MEPDQKLAFFADVPSFGSYPFPDSAPEDGDEGEIKPPTSRIQIAKVGAFDHPRYGKFKVTRDTFDKFIANFTSAVPMDELPGDFDHEPDYGGSTEACGWLKALHPKDDELWADVEWTWRGAWAIREKRFKFISPTWQMNYVDDEGNKHGPALLAFALTNRPFFSNMAVVTLSKRYEGDDRDQFADIVPVDDEPGPNGPPCDNTECSHTHCKPLRDAAAEAAETARIEAARASDSRRAMELTKALSEVFGLDADATEEKVLKAARTAQAKAEDTSTRDQIVTAFGLDTDASDEDIVTAAREAHSKSQLIPNAGYDVVLENGDLVMNASQVLDLNERAAAGDAAVAELAEVTFSTAWDHALRGGRVKPTQREQFHTLYQSDAASTLATLENLPVVVNTARIGQPGHAAATLRTPGARDFSLEGESAELEAGDLERHRKAEAFALANNIDYIEAYHRVAAGAAI